jgi:hypothetical protein
MAKQLELFDENCRHPPTHARFGSLADITAVLANVCFTPESGHHRKPSSCPLSARRRHLTDSRQSQDRWDPEMLNRAHLEQNSMRLPRRQGAQL